MHCLLDPQALEILERRFSEDALHAARERPLARTGRPCCLLQRKSTFETRTRPALEAMHDGIGVNQMIDERVRRLRRPRVDDQIVRGQGCELWADASNQP